jgi:hypothetical protein
MQTPLLLLVQSSSRPSVVCRDTGDMTARFGLAEWQRWWKRNGSQELRDLLLIWWDPIGVYGVPEAKGEYDDYAGTVARLLREGAREAEIAGFLRQVEEERITLAGDAPNAAHKIVEWYDRVMAQLGPNDKPA